jgi:hypothetical protein
MQAMHTNLERELRMSPVGIHCIVCVVFVCRIKLELAGAWQQNCKQMHACLRIFVGMDTSKTNS